jgi:hypothetical protein
MEHDEERMKRLPVTEEDRRSVADWLAVWGDCRR